MQLFIDLVNKANTDLPTAFKFKHFKNQCFWKLLEMFYILCRNSSHLHVALTRYRHTVPFILAIIAVTLQYSFICRLNKWHFDGRQRLINPVLTPAADSVQVTKLWISLVLTSPGSTRAVTWNIHHGQFLTHSPEVTKQDMNLCTPGFNL